MAHPSSPLKNLQSFGSLSTSAFFFVAAVSSVLALTYFVSVISTVWIVLFVLSAIFISGCIFLPDRKTIFICIITLRASCDIVFESIGTGANESIPRIGGIVNLSVVLLALSYFVFNVKKTDKQALYTWSAFFIVCAYGIFFSTVKMDAIRITTNWVSNFAVFICALHLVDSRKSFVFCIKIVILSSLIPAAYGLYETVINVSFIGNLYRVQSTFSHPNILAFYLVLVIPCCFYLLKTEKLKTFSFARFFMFAHFFLLTGLLVLTQTRSAWITFFVFFFLYAFFFEKRYFFYLFLFAVCSYFIPGIQDRLSDLSSGVSVSNQDNNSFAWRLALWQEALSWMEPMRYLFGYGLGDFTELSPKFFSHGGGIKWDAHNSYVQWFFDIGAVGLLAYLWLHIKTFSIVLKLHKIDPLVMFLAMTTIANYLIMSFSDNMTFYLVFNWYYWFILGAVVALQNIYHKNRTLTSTPAL